MKKNVVIAIIIACISTLLISCDKKEKVSDERVKPVSKTFYNGYIYGQEEMPIFLMKGSEIYMKYPNKEAELLVNDVVGDHYMEQFIPETNNLVYQNTAGDIIGINIENKQISKLGRNYTGLYPVRRANENNIIYNNNSNGSFTLLKDGKKISLCNESVKCYFSIGQDKIVFITNNDDLHLWSNGTDKLIENGVKEVSIASIWSGGINQLIYSTYNDEVKNYDIKNNIKYLVATEGIEILSQVIATEKYIVYNQGDNSFYYNKESKVTTQIVFNKYMSRNVYNSAYFMGDYLYVEGSGGICSINLVTNEVSDLKVISGFLQQYSQNNICLWDFDSKNVYRLENGNMTLLYENVENFGVVCDKYIVKQQGVNKVIINDKEIEGEFLNLPIMVDENLLLYQLGDDLRVYDMARDKVMQYGEFKGYDKIIFLGQSDTPRNNQ